LGFQTSVVAVGAGARSSAGDIGLGSFGFGVVVVVFVYPSLKDSQLLSKFGPENIAYVGVYEVLVSAARSWCQGQDTCEQLGAESQGNPGHRRSETEINYCHAALQLFRSFAKRYQ
jgi:hypothetical protein